MTTKQFPQTALLNLLQTKIEVFNKLATEINSLAEQANLPIHVNMISEEIVSEAQSQEESACQRLRELETLVADIKETIGCNYVQLENKDLLKKYLAKHGFTKKDE